MQRMAIETQTPEPSVRTDADAEIQLSVVAPAYNEAGNLTPLVEEVIDVLDGLPTYQPYEIVIVDDGSTDETVKRLHHLVELFPPVRAVELTRNFGQSPALAAGIEQSRGDIVVTTDADGQNDPKDIPGLLSELEAGADCVSGRRKDRRDPWGKRLPSWVQTHLAKATGPDINDFGCTLKAYRREALDDIDLYGEGHRYIPAMVYDRGYEVTERDVNHREREHGESHYGLGRLARGFVDLLFHTFWNRYSTRPIHLLGGGGLCLLGSGFLLGGFSLLQRFVFGVPLGPRTPRLILTALLVMFGLQVLVFGVLAEMVTKLHYRNQTEYRIHRVLE